MDHICENCKYIAFSGKRCLFINSTLPAEKTCTMWKVNLKKEIEKMREEVCNDGACEIKR